MKGKSATNLIKLILKKCKKVFLILFVYIF